MDKRGGGVSSFPVENFLSHRAEKFRRGTLLCFTNFGYRKSLDKRGEGVSRFSVEIFCLTVPKISAGESFTVAIISGIEKVGIKGVSQFSVEVFVSLYRNISLENTLVFQKNSFIENFHAYEGGHHRFVGTFCLTETKSFVKEPFCFPEIYWYRKKIMDKRWHITIFFRNFHVSLCRKLSSGNPTVFEKIFGFKKFYA